MAAACSPSKRFASCGQPLTQALHCRQPSATWAGSSASMMPMGHSFTQMPHFVQASVVAGRAPVSGMPSR